ncbi:cysteine hydrolase [Clostridium perfringens]|uniref:isochorismatase family cysteine hydrolase n=1 Tax=Clostridium perfringens TaxID=1502 RepID=UPI0018D7908A|nr:isochorismatase family cysteine hydrolase [Clostridium perfringens]MCR1963230.1 cysteine hydrolase [Clostridium perfringens]MDB2046463.1 cysteine hydrolase [Clostridium perfringens]MDB2058700.1 cysteine hydrolase [Clostridium perfringens]QPR52065.1 cysteine hydrolase [Clostridium perfringens]
MDTKELLLNESNEMISGIYERLQSLESLDLKSLDKNRTMLLIVDINKGFAKAGALYSDRIEKLINPISNLAKYALNNGIKVKAFTDYHTEDSIELKVYPKHCMKDTDEWELVDELNLEGIEVIKKNSTNGFLEENFILNKEEIDNVIIVGDCTDICIYQLAISLRAEFNRVNKDGEIYVPKKLVDTFDMPMHKANFMNYVFLNSMLDNGVKVIEDIILD